MRSSKSTWWPSKSGPSTQANLISSPILTRQPPHMPVPSTITGLRLTIVLILCGRVTSAQPFIMIGGPIATHFVDVGVLGDRLPDALGDDALDAGRAVVGAHDQLVAHAR